MIALPKTRFALVRPDQDSPDYTSLRDYQCAGVDALRAHRCFLLADEMRLGKSAQALRALPRRARAIVVCPRSVVGVWLREVRRWRPDLRASPVEELRRPMLGEVLVIAWTRLPERIPGSDMVVADDLSDAFVIGDEVHFVMSHGSRRTKAFRALRRQTGRAWGLSATPMPGDPRQLWGVLVSLGISHCFRDDDEFLALCKASPNMVRDRRTGRLVQRGWHWGEISPEVKERVARVSLRRLAKDHASLPPKIYTDVPCEAPSSLLPFLESVKDAWGDVDSGDELPPFELLAEARKALALSRTDAAVEFVRDGTSGAPVVVFSAHREPVRAMGALKDAAWVVGDDSSHGDREFAIELFRQGKVRVLAMTIQTGGVGLDLSRADGIVFVDRPYVPGDEAQAEARGDAVGKRTPVAIWRLTSDHPIDVRVGEILDRKRGLQDAFGLGAGGAAAQPVDAEVENG